MADDVLSELQRLHRRITVVGQHLDLLSTRIRRLEHKIDHLTHRAGAVLDEIEIIDDYEDELPFESEVIPWPKDPPPTR